MTNMKLIDKLYIFYDGDCDQFALCIILLICI